MYEKIECTTFDHELRLWHVDADIPGIGRRTIAFIDDLTFRVIYCDPGAEPAPQVKAAIHAKVEELKAANSVYVGIRETGNDVMVSIHLRTKFGDLSAEAEPSLVTGTGYDAIYTGATFSWNPYVYSDLLSARVGQNGVGLYVYNDVNDEDWQCEYDVPGSEIGDLVDSCREA